MKVRIDRSFPIRFRRDIHPIHRQRMPELWIEARERASALPCDDAQFLGDVFDGAIAKLDGAIWRNKSVLRGIPCVRKTRIPVYQICGMMGEGYSVRRVARLLCLSDRQVRDALKFASIVLEQ
jgi:uncharacterized protein (DUF433 family)